MLLTCHDDVVQAFPADRADQAFRIAVLPRRACRSRMIADAKRANAANEYAAVTSIPIADQIARDLLPTTGRRQLVGTRPGLPRRSTMICCRNTRISASNAARGRNRSTTIPKIILQRSNIPQKIIRFCVSRQLDGIYDRDRTRAVAIIDA